MTTGIIWDLDGTLYDFYTPSKLALYRTWEKAYFQEMVCPQKSQELFDTQNGEYLWEYKFWESLYSIKSKHLFTDISKQFLELVINESWPLVSKEHSKDLAEHWWSSFFDSIKLYPWVMSVFHKLEKFQIPMGLLSNSPQKIGELKLAKLGLTEYFDSDNIIWAQENNEPKPKPIAFWQLCSMLHLDPGNALVIGDNYKTDIMGAINAEMNHHLYVPGKELELFTAIAETLEGDLDYVSS